MPENLELFDNKAKTYGLFEKYYKRELIHIHEPGQGKLFDQFIDRHEHIIVKPLAGSGGKGVRLLDKEKDSIICLIQEYSTGFVMEPVVENVDIIAEFHRESLNTVRIVTVRLNDRVEIAFACARFGRDGNIVDNAAAGGILCAIDTKTGQIYAAIDKMGKRCINHPNSKKTLLGFKYPQWSKVIPLVKKLAGIVPNNRYPGWDMALTNQGWVLIEANARSQFVGQKPLREGMKTQFDDYLKELHLL